MSEDKCVYFEFCNIPYCPETKQGLRLPNEPHCPRYGVKKKVPLKYLHKNKLEIIKNVVTSDD